MIANKRPRDGEIEREREIWGRRGIWTWHVLSRHLRVTDVMMLLLHLRVGRGLIAVNSGHVVAQNETITLMK